jgi:hypothetical protein
MSGTIVPRALDTALALAIVELSPPTALRTALALATVELSPSAEDTTTESSGDITPRLLAPFCDASLTDEGGGSTE